MSVALVAQHAKRIRRIILSSVTYPAVPHISTLSHKRHDFRGGRGGLLNRRRVFWFSPQLLSETFLTLRRIQRDITNLDGATCKVAINFQAPCVLYIGQAFRYSPENVFYIFNQQIYFILLYLLDRASLI